MGAKPVNQIKKISPITLSFSIFGVLFSLVIISILALSNVRVLADSSATASVTVTSACTLSGGGNNYSSSISPGSSHEFGTSTIKAVCNDSNGYSLYAIGFTGDSYTGDNNKMVGTNTAGTISAGSSGNDSYWAMKLSAVSGDYAPTIENSFTSYQAIPASLTKVASLASNTDSGPSATGSSVNATYKVNVSSSQAADTYNGKVKYVLVHPNTTTAGTYTINYYANGGTGTMDSETNVYNFEDHTIPDLSTSTIVPPTGYQLAGWCTVQDNTASGVVLGANPQTTCTGTSYPNNGTIPSSTINAGGTLDLYAYWQIGQYTITLDQNEATLPGSTSTTVTYLDNTLGSITLPERSYTVTGFTLPSENYADGATVTFSPGSTNCTNASSCNYTYSFNGWYQEAAATNKIANNATTPALLPSTTYTNSESQWIATENKTLYAGWTSPASSISLPSITKTGYDCGWTTTSSGATTIPYPSTTTIPYPTITPDTNTTLYGVCTLKNNLSLRISFDSHVESVAVHDVSALGPVVGTVTTSGNSVSGLTYNTNYFLVPTYASGYELDAWAQDAGTVGELSSTTAANPYYRIGDGTNGVTLTSKSSRLYMQNLTAAQCQEQATNQAITVYDRRDESDYTVRYINNACWMTQNLRITHSTGQPNWTISKTDSNFSNVNTWNIHAADLSRSSHSYTQAQSHVPTTTDADTNGNKPMDTYTTDQLGVWYNYCAASAGQVCDATQMDATQDICPAGWKLPTYNTTPGNFSGITGSATITGANANKFTPIYGGYYFNGSLYNATTDGYWWSSTARDAVLQYYLYYNYGSLNVEGVNYKSLGRYVRCMRSS